MNQANYSEINQSLPRSYIFDNALITLALLEIAPWQTCKQDQFGGGCGPTRSRRNWRWTGGARWYPSLKRVVHLSRSQETQKEMNHLPQIFQRIVLGRVVVKFSQKTGSDFRILVTSEWCFVSQEWGQVSCILICVHVCFSIRSLLLEPKQPAPNRKKKQRSEGSFRGPNPSQSMAAIGSVDLFPEIDPIRKDVHTSYCLSKEMFHGDWFLMCERWGIQRSYLQALKSQGLHTGGSTSSNSCSLWFGSSSSSSLPSLWSSSPIIILTLHHITSFHGFLLS